MVGPVLPTKLMEAGVATKVLEQNYEAWMEATAIQYTQSSLSVYSQDIGMNSIEAVVITVTTIEVYTVI